MTCTYSELLFRRVCVPCSCCGEKSGIGSALVTTDNSDSVRWIVCRRCVEVCDRLESRPGQLTCKFDPCKDDPKYTRLSQHQYEVWRKRGEGALVDDDQRG